MQIVLPTRLQNVQALGRNVLQVASGEPAPLHGVFLFWMAGKRVLE